ncbi:AMP-binding protein [Corynebacterium sp. MC-04]|uniref:AMP-binding protein n=1 Tax=Corynebacterium parakroppenstedtii TaxID=2828363 RepID=A0ABS9HLM2_9CORY|nr:MULTISPECIES: AMP-binding protein [Corynebacterium]MDU3196845.1 AMP-binding protein [Corynebacterium kroppenstedtii]MBY0788611.1 AMP-binding protein [Corynebacterium parakroppenstedtii]MBY0792671.1 AMP-binding protein [Corynebacterium parakroppenstedtii]MBY0796775.1 AMP-binding protein [Corynebacterium parakroppenstedtii]MCF6770029.1 AMP-binding protein [Corynebacterium parakroppenstedtii]
MNTKPYTFETRVPRILSKKEIFKQLVLLLKRSHQKGFVKSNGWADLRKDLKDLKRWGGLEGFIIARGARQVPNRPALIDDDGTLTYKELYDAAYKLAQALHSRGLGDGANVAVMALNGRGSILPLCARQMAGYNIFMINANASAPQIEHYLDFHQVDALVVDEEFIPLLTDKSRDRTVFVAHRDNPSASNNDDGDSYISISQLIQTAPSDYELPEKPHKGMHVVMTSGTTGMPKGVVRRPLNSPQGFASVADAMPLERGMTLLLTAVLFHAYGWAYMGFAFFTQSTVIARRHFSGSQVLNDFKKYDVTMWVTAATRIREVIGYMDEQGMDRYDGLKIITNSGSPLIPYEIKRADEKFGPVLYSMYGSSETSAVAVAPADELVKDPELTGKIYPGCVVKIFDQDGNELPEGEEGLVAISCFDLFAGYTDPNTSIPSINGYWPMGDRGVVCDGKLYVRGRADDLVITQYGEKVYPIELEESIMGMPGVQDVSVLAADDKTTGQALRAYVIRAADSQGPDADDVRKWVEEHLSKAHVPRDVVFVDNFTRGPAGKVIKRALPHYGEEYSD